MLKIYLFAAAAFLAVNYTSSEPNADLYKYDTCIKAIPSVISHGGRRKKYVSETEMLDCIDERAARQNETNAVKVFEAKSADVKERTIADFKQPTCDFSNWTMPECSLQVTLFNTDYEIKVEVQLNLKRLSIYAALSVNEIVLIDAQFYLSKICVRFLPYLPKIGVCGHIYYFDVNFGSPFFVEACLTIVVADLIELRFYCIKLENWELSREDNIEPDEVGIFAVVFKKDRVIFEFNAAIPELLLDLLGDAVAFITDAIIVMYETIQSAVTNVIDKITDFFRPTPLLR